ncbi:MAG TPA: hypothetical protein VEU09_02790 [Candidatus Binatia bacterium]|nr:hypothetical protein [Candidatus Binatia bacterium]
MRPLASIINARTPIWIAAILLLVAAAASPARANLGAEGEPTFGISGWFKAPPRLSEEATLLVRIWGGDASDHPVTSVARISIPEGIEIVSGDTVSVARVDRHSRRRADRVVSLVIRAVRSGNYVIRGRLEIDEGEEHGRDETDFILPLTLEPETLPVAQAPRATRYENVRHGQRYRYAGRYLVPIDSTEALLEEEITAKPKPMAQDTASCHGCPGPLPAAVPFVVMVGSDGRVRDTRFLDIQEEGTIDPNLVAAAGAALAHWQFQPAKAREKPVADYAVVFVPVRDGQP